MKNFDTGADAEGIQISCDFGGGQPGGFAFPAQAQPPEGAIQFSRDVWLTGAAPYRANVYITETGEWEHIYDSTVCEHGPSVPLGRWVEADIPFSCRDGKLIRLKAGGPFWVDDLPVSDSGWLQGPFA